MKRFGFLVLTLSFIILSIGCSQTEVVSDESKVLRIYATNEDYLRREYIQLYEVTHPQVELEFITYDHLRERFEAENPTEGESFDWTQALKDLLNAPDGPDVIISHTHSIHEFINDGLLMPLEPFIDSSQFNLDDIGYAIIEGIRDLGQGTIYALSPTFSSTALYYNKNMFDRQNIPYPEDGMSYEEILQMAHLLSYEEDGTTYYGYAFGGRGSGDPYQALLEYGEMQGLSLFSEEGDVTINTTEWQEVWQFFKQLYDQNVFPIPDIMRYPDGGYSISYGSDFASFDSGRVAMMIGDFYEIRQLQSGRSWDPNFEPFEWDLAAAPINKVNPDYNRVYLNELMAINFNSQNVDLAWEFISFLNGEEVAKVKANSGYSLLSRPGIYKQNPQLANVNIEAFYVYKPEPIEIPEVIDEDLAEDEEQAAQEKQREQMMLNWEVRYLGADEFEQVLSGEKTVEQALADFQRKGEEKLANR